MGAIGEVVLQKVNVINFDLRDEGIAELNDVVIGMLLGDGSHR
jgi:hypothetical protein